jgi:hypothetical protein
MPLSGGITRTLVRFASNSPSLIDDGNAVFHPEDSDAAIRFGFGYRYEILMKEVAMRSHFSAVLPPVIA